jgi:transcriptional regulator with GAF, ATPase, and Fis domain
MNFRTDDLYEALQNICRAARSSPAFDEIIHAVLMESARVLGCDSSLIAVNEGSRWVVKKVYNLPQEISDHVFTPEEISAAEHVVKAWKCISFGPVPSKWRIFSEQADKYGLSAALAIPLNLEKEMPGILLLTSRAKEITFGDSEIDLADKMGTAISVVLQNIHLFEENRQSEMLTVRVNELSDSVAAIRDNEGNFLYSVSQIQDRFPPFS